MNSENKIQCPKCQHSINVNDILARQLEEKIRKSLSEEMQVEKIQFEEEKKSLEQMKRDLEKLKKNEEQNIQDAVKSEMEKEKIKLKRQIEEEQIDRINKMKEELNDKSEKIKSMNLLQAELEAKEREMNELETKIRSDEAKKFSNALQLKIEEVKNSLEDEKQLVIKDLEKKLEDQVKLTEEMRRKQLVGSQQAQGESQELLIEEFLKGNFPIDKIKEVKKGARGADVSQEVFNQLNQVAGKILYESKRAENWSGDWINKLKEDMKEEKADIGVLITSVFPKGVERITMIDGVWVCSLNEFRGISFVLRDAILKFQNLKKSQENKGEKMIQLYDYLTGNEFREIVRSLVEIITQMQQDLIKERNTMTASWKKRQAQIESILGNTSSMYGTIEGISNKDFMQIDSLEMIEEKFQDELMEVRD